jgi:hypothetical protein
MTYFGVLDVSGAGSDRKDALVEARGPLDLEGTILPVAAPCADIR